MEHQLEDQACQGTHQHGAEHFHDEEEMQGAQYWQEFYAQGNPWSGKPNTLLVLALDEESPQGGGRALDVGCGTGADAIWLASNGWQVCALDISQTALDIAARHAAQAGVADKITWVNADFAGGLPVGEWDLISMAYLHLPDAELQSRLVREGLERLAPGGQIVIMGHENHPEFEASRRTLDQTLALFDGSNAEVVLSQRQQLPSHKNPGTIREDYVVKVVK